MKTLSALALLALLAGCHFDKLFSAGERPVSHGTPVGLTFYTTLGTARAGQRITPPVQVGIVDSVGNPIAGVDSAVAITLGANPGGARLSGTDTVAAVNGVATFADLHIDKPATGYTLRAAFGTAAPLAESAPFAISPTPPPPPPTGDLSVTTATTGPSQDPDGYTVSVDGGQQSRSIPTSGTVTFQGLTAGNHTVTLS